MELGRVADGDPRSTQCAENLLVLGGLGALKEAGSRSARDHHRTTGPTREPQAHMGW